MREAEQQTAGESRFVLQVAANYGGQWDIAQAAQRLAREVQAGHLQPEDITPGLLQGCLATGDLPLPDLCIRTGGEHRISNFLLWQLAYSAAVFLRPVLAGLQARGHAQGAGRFFQAPAPLRQDQRAGGSRGSSMLKQRIITALILLPIALGGFFLLDGAWFALFIGAVVTLGAWEWARLAGLAAQPQRVAYAAAVAALLYGAWLLPALAPWLLGAAVLWWLAATLLVLSYPQSSRYWGGLPGKLLIGLLILLPAWQGLVQLKQWPQANALIIAVMVLVWGADIGAYFAGKTFGKRKLAPRVSPGKSWEGFHWWPGCQSADHSGGWLAAGLAGRRLAAGAGRRCPGGGSVGDR